MPTLRSIIISFCGIIFKLGVRVKAEGISYTDQGRSKKEAKRAAAGAALSILYPQYAVEK